MKQSFPRYERGTLKNIEKKFSKKDKEMINNYLIFCGGSGGTTTVTKYHKVLIKIVDVFGGGMDKIDLERLRKFLFALNNSELLPATKNEIKKVLKRFLKENYDDWSSRFKQLDDKSFKCTNEVNEERINSKSILNSEKIEKLVRGSESLKYKSLIMLMYESAARPEELLKAIWKDIDLEKGDIKLRSSKTGNQRINPIQNSIIHLKNYKQQYPFMDVTEDDYIFVNPNNRDKHISRVAAGLYLKRLGKKVLNEDIFMYLIRHTRATELHKTLPPLVYTKFMDHSLETAKRYSHLNNDDVREVMFKDVYNVEELTEDKRHELEKRIAELEAKEKRNQPYINAKEKEEAMYKQIKKDLMAEFREKIMEIKNG